jgi:hypothetical protein
MRTMSDAGGIFTRVPMKTLIVPLFLLAACTSYGYQLRWPEGTTAAQYKKDSDECEIETGTGFVDLANEMDAVGTSAAARDDSRMLWNRCMGARGYKLVRAPRGE